MVQERKFCGVDGHLKWLCQNGQLKDSINMLYRLSQIDMHASDDTHICLLQGCINARALSEGQQVHALIIKNRFKLDLFLGNMLVNLYAKCGKVSDARPVFEKMPERNVFTWTTMIGAYAKLGNAKEAFNLFWRMESEGVKPNKVTFLSILKACVSFEQGKQVHTYIAQSGLESDNFLSSSLIDMYSKCGNFEHARQVFDEISERDVVAWNSMIGGYAQNGHGDEALKLFLQMQQEGVEADEVTFSSVLKACTIVGSLKQGKQLHCYISRSRTNLTLVIANALIYMYSKCGSFETAHYVFSKMAQRDVISWTAMISGCAEHGILEEAFKLFWQMQKEGIRPDEIAYVSVLKACANMASLELGKQIHAHIVMSGFKLQMLLGNVVVDMYAKCGSMEYASQAFEKMHKRDLISWSAMVSGYALHGNALEALQFVARLQFEGMKLDHVTYVGVLSACSHAGLVDEGFQTFDSMRRDHGIMPTAEHYVCIVDLLGRAGRLEEAMEVIGKLPFQPSVEIWTALLAACRNYGDSKLAEHASKCILKLEPQNTAAFVLLSNIYAEAGRLEEKSNGQMIDGG